MAQAGNQDLTERFIQFYRNYYREEIGGRAQRYPNEQRSLYIEYDDLYQFDRDLAEDFRTKPEQMREYAEEALRLDRSPQTSARARARPDRKPPREHRHPRNSRPRRSHRQARLDQGHRP